MQEAHILVQDNDGHWYIIPESRREEFEVWIATSESDTHDPDAHPGERIGGSPSMVRIFEYAID